MVGSYGIIHNIRNYFTKMLNLSNKLLGSRRGMLMGASGTASVVVSVFETARNSHRMLPRTMPKTYVSK